ncbi:MAG: hypothetical protein HRT72_09325 [Flavobacteriales bacterium]|nr:hypothetical protein [Flavobacteriales bacterium]
MGRKKKKNSAPQRKLDLHGESHADVDRLVENYVFLTEYPHDIITGNSGEMHRIVKAVLDRHGFKYEIGDNNNKGYIRIIGYE